MAANIERAPTSTYEADFHAWIEAQLELLHAGRFGELDVEHLIEELEGLSASQRRELHSRLQKLIHHLLKWQYQAQQRSASWQATIDEQRDELERLFEQSPSLRRLLPQAVARVYPKARRDAARETGLPSERFPDQCPYEETTLLGDEWPDEHQEQDADPTPR